MKHRANRGCEGGLSFYRDKDGVEADLVVECGDRRVVVEAKSASTASSGLVAGSERLLRHLSVGDRPVESLVVYGGDEAQQRSHASLLPWRQLHARDWVTGVS